MGLQAEEMQGVLIGGERAVGLGKGGLQVGDDLGLGSFCRQLRWWAPSQQNGTEGTLGPREAMPETLPGPVTPLKLGHRSCCCRDAAGEDLSQESPHYPRAQAQAADFVGQPDTDGPSTTTLRMPVAAVDPSRPQTLSLALVIPHQAAMTNQSPHRPAMRTRRQLEPLHQMRPFCLTPVKPTLHDPPEIPLLPQ